MSLFSCSSDLKDVEERTTRENAELSEALEPEPEHVEEAQLIMDKLQ